MNITLVRTDSAAGTRSHYPACVTRKVNQSGVQRLMGGNIDLIPTLWLNGSDCRFDREPAVMAVPTDHAVRLLPSHPLMTAQSSCQGDITSATGVHLSGVFVDLWPEGDQVNPGANFLGWQINAKARVLPPNLPCSITANVCPWQAKCPPRWPERNCTKFRSICAVEHSQRD